MLRRLLVIFGYVLGVAAIVAITVGLVAYGNDYAYDFSTGRIIQKGHVIIESLPTGLRVKADGKLLGKKTTYQAAYKVGNHTFGLDKDGFWPWEKTLKIIAGRVALANYVIMVPKKPVEGTLDTKAQILVQSISKDHRHLAYITGGTDPAVYTLDLGNKKVQKQYTPKAAILPVGTTPAQPAEVLHDVTWSDDASHMLIVTDIGGVVHHRLAEAGSTDEPQDLTQVFGFNLTGLQFSGSNWRQLYWVSPDGLRRLDVGSTTVSGVLAEKVTQFWPQRDHVLYVQQAETGGRSLWSLDNGGKHQVLIQALVESDSYAAAETTYNGTDELVIVPEKTGIATLYTDIYGDTPISKVLAKSVTAATFSPDGHKLALTSPGASSVYDLERSEIDHNFTMYPLSNAQGQLVTLTWFDNAHLLSHRGEKIFWSEFDGANIVDFGKAYGLLPAYSDPDKKAVVMLRPTDTGTVKIVQVQVR
jgi:hypothetical protein